MQHRKEPGRKPESLATSPLGRITMQQARNARNRALGSAVMAAALGIVVLSGCTMVGDGLTGVKVRPADATNCVKDCNDIYRTLYDQEQKLHLTNIDACQALSP